MIRALVTLVLIGTACGGLLVATDTLTRDDILSQRQARERALAASLLGAPLPAAMDVQGDLFGACDAGQFGRFEAAGYAGPIRVLALWQDNGLSMRVTAHRETPGIGDFIEHARSPWLAQHDGASAAEWAAVDTVSGATITSNTIRRLAAEASTVLHKAAASCER